LHVVDDSVGDYEKNVVLLVLLGDPHVLSHVVYQV